ncbi:protein kinase domain-containing protein [Stieleria varia]|uniref:non-specific serine/threonine protein kinase n=1 Tax=Stieleria varia TaxID=2528005 RepID=A0A5C6AWJ6_9BACT|nr:protein kinase [Stieleria varia]TWU02494.1 Serine/threonine-protein kinase PrkC [Stieleria varia]
MNQQVCDPNRLSSFVRGELSDQAERELTSHLDECESCGLALEQQVAEASAWREASVFLGEPVAQAHEAEFSVTRSRDAQIELVLSQLSPTDDPDSLGRIGGYEVTGAIGSGGMGVVLKARDQSLDRVVAVKVMAPHLAASGSARQRFAREAKAAAAVLHPNVIAIHGVSNEQALPYLVMPYVRGQSLQKRIDAEGPLPLVDILRIAAQVAAGLAAAHDQGLVHRDIKPGNILMEQGVERVTITDFGLARAVDDASMTCSGVIAGTPQYMSPEQARAEKIDHRSDLFSLGSVLYAMCTGHPPFRAESSFSVLRLITDKHPRPIRETNPDIPDWLCAIIQKLMAKDADDRFDSAKEVAELLEKCVAHVQQPLQFELPMIPEDHTSGVVTTDLSQWAKCVFSSPDHQRSFFGRHVWPFLERGKVRLNNDSIEWTFNSGLHQKIPLLCIEEVSIGHYSRLTHPARMDFLSIRYRDGDTVRTQLLTPLSSILTPVTTANAAVRRYADRLPQSVAEPNSSGSKRGWSSKFLATCFLPILLLAGVLIVLQWNKGTLRIESEADDVPIRVVQGKDVVEELTVSKSGKSVRIAAGNYKIEIGGQIDGLALDDDSVTLQRGGNDVVRIVKVAPVASALGDWPYGRLRKNLQEIKPPGGAPVIPSGDPISVAMGAELTRRLEAVPDGELDKWLVELERVTGDKLNGEMARQACRTYIVNRMGVLFEDGDWNTNTASRLFKQLQSLNPSEVEAWKNAFESLMKETIGQNDREVFDGGPSYAVPLVLISVDALFDDEIHELSSGTTDLSLASGMAESSIAQDLAIKYQKRLSQLAKQDIASWRSKVDRFGGTKLDAAMNIILLDDYFVDEKFQDGDFAATLGGTNPKDSAGQVTDSAGGAVAPSANQFSVSLRRETVNNLTHIINALHHYHEVHGQLPPGTISGKDGRGGPPHSWRVELLPLLGHQELYDQYHFDEPWNSEHNKGLLAKMPDVYRSPLDKADSTNTSYFGVVSDDISKRAAQLQEMRDQRDGGPNDLDESAYIGDDDPATLQAHFEQYTPEATVFWKQHGASFRDMLDGTSNCIAVIEAKRDVPWTKPDDIEYSADQPLPKFGGWFEQGVHAAFADGTVKFLANDNDEQTIRNLLTISDGQPVEPLLVRRLRIHGAVAVPEDEPEVAAGPETYQVPGGPLLMIQSDKESVLTEADIIEVTATTDPNNPSGGDIVTMTLTEEAGARFLEATTKLSEQGTSGYMVITFDRKVLSAPRVLTPIGNKLTITGNIDAKALAEQIQAAMDEIDAPKKPASAEAELGGVERVQAVPQEEGEYVTIPLKVEWHSATAMEQILGQRHLTILADGVMKEDDHSNAVNRVLRSVLHDCRLDSYKLVARDESDYWDARLFVPRKPEYLIGSLWYSDPIRTLRIGDRHTPVPADTLTQDEPQAKLDAELKNGFQLRLDNSTMGEPRLSSAGASQDNRSAKFESRITGQFGFLTAKQVASVNDAVAAFNRMARQSEVGRKQQELTTDEVVARYEIGLIRTRVTQEHAMSCRRSLTRKRFSQDINCPIPRVISVRETYLMSGKSASGTRTPSHG